jgi:excisionase family DNA binding protein
VTDNLRPLTVDDLARLLGLSRQRVYALASKGAIPGRLALPGCRRVLFSRPVIMRWLAAESPAVVVGPVNSPGVHLGPASPLRPGETV